MALEIPGSAQEVENRAQTDVQRELPESNPRLKNSWLLALVTGYSNRIFDFYLQLTEAIKQSFPDTATGTFLERWAAIYGLDRGAANQASGNIVATGAVTSIVPLGKTLSVTGAGIYTTTLAGTISTEVLSVSSIERSGQTATVTTTDNHGLADNVLVTIAGADQSEYNLVDTALTVTGLNEFQYQVSGSPVTPATGTITVSFDSASIPVISNDFGQETNLSAGTPLTLQQAEVGIDDTLAVDFGGLGGGVNQEIDPDLRDGLQTRIQNPVAHFSAADIVDRASQVEGVTRVFVEEVTPEVGQVTIYFMRDNDENPIPSGSEVAEVRTKIEEIIPANTDKDADVFILAPVAVIVPFTFSALVPDTSTMRGAVTSNLDEFFDESTSVGVNIDEDAYRAAIFNTVDTVTGDVVSTFTLSTPSGDITIASGEIGVLDSVIYP